MADWNKPSNSSTKTNFPTEIRDLVKSAIKLNPSADSNIPTDALYYNQTTKRLQKWSGSAWVDVAIGVTILGIFAADSVADSITDNYLYAAPFTGYSVAANTVYANLWLPGKSYVTHATVTWDDSSGSVNGTRTIKLSQNGTVFQTFALNTTATNQNFPLSPPKEFLDTAASNILRCQITQGSGGAAADRVRVTVWGSCISG